MISLLVGSYCLVHFISVPFDRGANIPGAAQAPQRIIERLTHIPDHRYKPIRANTTVFQTLSDTYFEVFKSLQSKHVPCIIGGDHTISVGSVAAVSDFCHEHSLKLGVLWVDAHADFNTVESSCTKNLHGMPLAVLCKHTLPMLQFGNGLKCDQVALFGTRDVDGLELDRLQEHRLTVISALHEISHWIEGFDVIHVSFDMDVISPEVAPGVSAPVPGGLDMESLDALLKQIRTSEKLLSVDVVETNPAVDDGCETVGLAARVISRLVDGYRTPFAKR